MIKKSNDINNEIFGYLYGGDASNECDDVAKHVVGIHEEGEGVGDVTRDDFHREKGYGEEKDDVKLDRLELPEPLFYGHI